MWNFSHYPTLQGIAAAIYEQGGVDGAVCHRPTGLINVLLSQGDCLVAGR